MALSIAVSPCSSGNLVVCIYLTPIIHDSLATLNVVIDRRVVLASGLATLGSDLWLLGPAFGKTVAPAPAGLIEVGASGVKASAYDFSTGSLPDEDNPKASGFERFLPRRTTSLDTNPFPLKSENVEATSDVVTRFLNQLVNEKHIARDRIFIFGSSAIATQSHADYLAKVINEKTGHTIEYVDVAKESELGFKWVVLGHRRREVVFIDIGSGNSKGGYLERVGAPGQNFQYFSLPFGTKSLADEAKKTTRSYHSIRR
jgi:hypothetical protein